MGHFFLFFFLLFHRVCLQKKKNVEYRGQKMRLKHKFNLCCSENERKKNESIQSGGFMCERSFWSLCEFIKGLELPASSCKSDRIFHLRTMRRKKPAKLFRMTPPRTLARVTPARSSSSLPYASFASFESKCIEFYRLASCETELQR